MISGVPRKPSRTCGACNACCVVLDVAVVDSPAGSPCQHLRPSGGCGIYDDRPETCRAVLCLWLSGHFGDATQRPDRIGAMAGLAGDRKTLTFWLLDGCDVKDAPRAVRRQIEREHSRGRTVLVVHGERLELTTTFRPRQPPTTGPTVTKGVAPSGGDGVD